MVRLTLALVREGRWVGTGFGVDVGGRSRGCGGRGSGNGCGWIWPRLISTCVPYSLRKSVKRLEEVNVQLVSRCQRSGGDEQDCAAE